MAKKVSVSELTQFYTCQRAWFLQRVLKIKGESLLHLTLGSAVHDFIAFRLHNKKVQREFFFESKYKALRAFNGYWLSEIWPEFSLQFSGGLKWWALAEAKKCIRNYIDVAEGKGYPLLNEKKIKVYIPELGCHLEGRIDQARPTNPKWAQQQGIKNPGIVLIDLKTGRPQYWSKFEGATHKEQMRVQTPLVNNVQPTAYYYLYHAVYKKYPDAFLFWFLGGKRTSIITTTRTAQDTRNMFDIIRVFLHSINNYDISDFPKTPNTYNCKFCVFWNSCWQNRSRPKLSIPLGSENPQRPDEASEPRPLPVKKAKQLNLKLRGTRRKKLTEQERVEAEIAEYNNRMGGRRL